MKKQRKRQPQKKKTQAAAAQTPKTDRRALLRNGLLIAGFVGVGGIVTASTVMATIAEHDLTRVGQGVPMIVQVHDPQCPSCLDLQRETRAALKAFDDAELQYAVANLSSAAGAEFATYMARPGLPCCCLTRLVICAAP